MTEPIRVAVTGAAGQIGYSLLPRIAAGEMFGPDQPVRLQLLELDDEKSQSALRGVAMELEDGAYPLLASVDLYADSVEAFRDADWCLLVGAKPRRPGMTRADLLRDNGPIFVAQGRAIDAVVARDCQVVVVGNPANTNCLIAASQCRRIAPERFTAMVRLDQNRAVYLLARKAGVGAGEVAGAVVFGNHSDTMYPYARAATVSGHPATEVIADEEWLRGEFVSRVAGRGSEIIRTRGASSAASAAQALIDHVRAVRTASGDIYSMAVRSHGAYGFHPGVWAGLPVRTTAPGCWEVVRDLEPDEWERGKLAESNAELIRERDLAAECGFIRA